MTEPINKSQTIRLIDVYFIGPFMIYYALKENSNDIEKYILIVLGVLTIWYNGKNYLENKNIIRLES